jgi:hypothetical protein
MRHTIALAALVLVLAQTGAYHEDARWGFKIKAPKDWEAIPLKLDEHRQVAKFLSKREYTYTDSGGRGWSWEHRAQMVAVALVPVEGEDLAGYEAYEAYLEKVRGDDADVVERKAGKVGGLDVTQLRVALRGGLYGGTLRLTAWVFPLDGYHLAVEFEVLEKYEGKLSKTIDRCLASLRAIPRGGPLPVHESDDAASVTDAQLARLAPAERRERRIQLELELHERARATLPEDWTAELEGRFLVLNHADERAAENLCERGEAVLSFLDERFPYIGPDEYVRRPILRICKDYEEERTYRRGGETTWSVEDIEIVTYDDNEGMRESYEAESMSRRLVSLWLQERDWELSQHLPSWLRWGFENAFATALPKRKKLEFRPDDWDRDELRERVRAGKATLPRELVLLGDSDFYGSGYWDRQREAGALVRFLLSDDAARNATTRGVLDDYLVVLIEIADRIEAAKPPPPEKEEVGRRAEEWEALSDEEQKERSKAAREARAAEERELLNEVYDRTFGTWTDKDWAAFEKVYFKTLK